LAIHDAAILVDRAHAAWREVSKAGVVRINIKAAFPSVGTGRLVHTMKSKGIDRDLIRLTASFLSDRAIEMVIECNVMERRMVETGIPQGSPVSPILHVEWMATGSDVCQIVRKL
jgi:hypothetical protein